MRQRKTRGYDVMTAKERDYCRKRVWSTLRSVRELRDNEDRKGIFG